ncbi:MAG: hypothetical protein ACXADH_01140 [Candidatus Kariarchaeaceae archaeon]|jgi:hypothetical protein
MMESKWTTQKFEEMRKDWSNNTLVGWKLYYFDGTIIDSTQMKFEDAPQFGIEVFLKWYSRKKGGYSVEVQNGLDFYVLYSDIAESLDLPKEIKLGKNLPRENFDELLKIARADKTPVTEMV